MLRHWTLNYPTCKEFFPVEESVSMYEGWSVMYEVSQDVEGVISGVRFSQLEKSVLIMAVLSS